MNFIQKILVGVALMKKGACVIRIQRGIARVSHRIVFLRTPRVPRNNGRAQLNELI